jgi:predicted nucleic acid-binding protein
MNADAFIDTNVFLYAISGLAEEQEKATRARFLLLNENWDGRSKSRANSL